jgi:eukaryotic-like serine/threonine-protein kinase
MQCPRCNRNVPADFAFCPYDAEPLEPPTHVVPFDSFGDKKTRMGGAIVGDRYRITGFVNKGATARVYLAEEVGTHEQVVVKLYTPDAAHSDDARMHFRGEAEILAKLSHPNIIKVLGFGELQGRPYVITEPLRGEPLGNYLRREGKMPTDLGLAMMRHAALGLDAAHQAGVVHRDVKPGNLFLLGPIANPYGLKLIDFGLAQGERSARPQTDLVAGTIEYMAPEQSVSDPCAARTDVYGLGVVMFRVFTGQLPFDVETDLELLAHQMYSPAPPPSWLDESIDPRIERIVLRAMRKRPENRYPNMTAVVTDLERVLGLSHDERVDEAPRSEEDTYEPLTPSGRASADVLKAQFGREG